MVVADRRRTPVWALLGASTVSLLGEGVTAVAIPWFVYETTGSVARMGVVAAFTALARIIAMFFGGTLVDRIGFRQVSVLADVLSGVSVAAIPLLHHTVGLNFWTLILLVVLGALFDGPGSTARQSLLPDLAERAGMPAERANSLFQVSQRLSLLLGPAAGGVLIALLGASNVLWVDAATFAVSATAIGLLVPVLRIVREDATWPGYWADLRAGLRFIRDDQLLLWLAIMVATLNFLDAPLGSILLPVFARTTYGSVEALGFLLSLLGAGAFISALVFAVIGHRLPRRRTYLLAFLVVSLPYSVLTTAPPFPLAAAAMFTMGLASGPINPILMTVRQDRVPAAIRARIFGAFTSAAWVAIPLGQLVGGFAVDRVGTQVVFGAIAGCYLTVTVAMLFNPAFRAMDQAVPGDGELRPAR